MKKLIAVFGLAVAVMGVNSASANDVALQLVLSTAHTQDLIDWKVGDAAEFDVKAGSFGKLGTMSKSVASDEGTVLKVERPSTSVSIQKNGDKYLIKNGDTLGTISNEV